jgi:hypothetical protein
MPQQSRPFLTMYTQEGEMTYNDLKTSITGLTVQSLQEKEVLLESLWEDRRIVLAFLRHFG